MSGAPSTVPRTVASIVSICLPLTITTSGPRIRLIRQPPSRNARRRIRNHLVAAIAQTKKGDKALKLALETELVTVLVMQHNMPQADAESIFD
jgi:hypothetical protein